MNSHIKDDFWENAQGSLIPKSKVKAIDKLRDQTVRNLFEIVEGLHELLKQFKADGFADIASFIQISADQYGAKVGGNKGNVTLMSYDGRLKVQRNIAENISFDEQLQAAKQLIDECLEEWTHGSRDEIKALINNAFKVDKKGDISTTRVLSLRRIGIDHPKWLKAMEAISDSINVVGKKAYMRFYKRNDETGEYVPVSLDLASI